MKFFRLLLILIATLGLIVTISLPDREANAPASAYEMLPDFPLQELAEAEREALRPGRALLALDYVIENGLPHATVAAGIRERMVRELQADARPTAVLDAFGHALQPAALSAFDSLAGASVADLIVYGRVQPALEQAEARKDPFAEQLRQSREIAAVFPPSEAAVKLMKVANLTGSLTPALQQQLSEVLGFIRSSGNSSMAVAAIQDSIMPLYQLARKCKTWAEFDLLLRQAQSMDQVKVLARISGLSAMSSKQTAQTLLIAGGDALPGRVVNHILQNGQDGLDKLYASARKGPAGLQLVLRHPELPIAALIPESRPGFQKLMDGRWLEWRSQTGPVALAAKYGAVVAFCLLLLGALRTRLPGTDTGTRGQASSYWLGAFAVSVGVGLLFFLISLAPLTPQDGKTSAPNRPPGQGSARARPAPGAVVAGGTSLATIAIIATAVLVVQGICWAVAQRRLREISQNATMDRNMKLRQLENSDIFLDLPLYCGLGVTILSFILITTFGLGVTRFLAYSSTLVGIVLSVGLRLFHLHPLKERLITRKE